MEFVIIVVWESVHSQCLGGVCGHYHINCFHEKYILISAMLK